MPPPSDAAIREHVETVRRRLAQARAMQVTGEYDKGLALVAEAEREGRRIGYRPLLADTSYERGDLQFLHGDYADAARTLRAAYVDGVASRHDETAAWAATTLVSVNAHLTRFEDAETWSQVAEASAERLQRRDEIDGMLATHRAWLHDQMGRYEEALAEALRARDLHTRALGPDHHRVAQAYNYMGQVYDETGRYAEALDSYARAEAIDVRALGADHPVTAAVAVNIANVLGDSGEHERAIAVYERSLALYERVSPQHPDIASIHNNLGGELQALGKVQEAVQAYERAMTLWEQRLGPSYPVTAGLLNLGRASLDLGRPRVAFAYIQRADAMAESVLGPEHPRRADTLKYLATAQRELGRLDLALEAAQRSLALYEKCFGAQSPRLAPPLLELGLVHLARHAPTLARAPLEKALVLGRAETGEGLELAAARFALARALPGPEGRRALELAQEARRMYAADGPRSVATLATVDAWLAPRRPEP